MGMIIIILIFTFLKLLGNWKIFKKAGKKGWEALIPIKNSIIKYKITNTNIKLYYTILALEIFWIIEILIYSTSSSWMWMYSTTRISSIYNNIFTFELLTIYFINIIFKTMVNINLAKKFNKSTAFTVGLIYCSSIFTLILGFNKDKYLNSNEKSREQEIEVIAMQNNE